jgi:L-threonylcarbamoyladenylate synthase
MKISLEKAIVLLKSERIVAVPTETVYGLAARYDCEQAITSIFETKNRPLDHPLIVHIASIDWLDRLALDIKPYVFELIQSFWPGPLTVVLKRKKSVNDLVTAGQDTVAIRMPDHPLLLEVIKRVGVPIVAPSANAFCKTSPTSADHVESNFLSKIPVLDGGPCKVGIESTIVLATEDSTLTLLRPGILSKKEIAQVAHMPFTDNDISNVRAPGKKNIHYQPGVPIIAFENGDRLTQACSKNDQKRYFIMALNVKNTPNHLHHLVTMPNCPSDYSKLLYEKWYCVSSDKFDNILIELPPDEDRWQGIRDRILKAASTDLFT